MIRTLRKSVPDSFTIWFSFLLFGFLFSTSMAQEVKKDSSSGIEKLFTERIYTCEEIILNCSRLIPSLYSRSRMDSLTKVVNYWRSSCGQTVSLTRFGILASLDSTFTIDSLLWSDVIFAIQSANQLSAFQKTERLAGDTSRLPFPQYRSLDPSFDTLCWYLADTVARKYPTGSLAGEIGRYFAGYPDSLFEVAQHDSVRTTPFGKTYHSYTTRVRKRLQSYSTIITGVWLPSGKKKVWGTQPLFGYSFGATKGKLSGEFIFLFNAISPHNEYITKGSDGKLYSSWTLLGAIIGLEGAVEVLRSNHHQFQLLTGAGLQVYTTMFKDETKDQAQADKFGLGLSAGIGYAYYPSVYNSTFIGIQPRLSWSTVDNGGGTDVSGGGIELRLVFGFGMNLTGERQRALRALRYRY